MNGTCFATCIPIIGTEPARSRMCARVCVCTCAYSRVTSSRTQRRRLHADTCRHATVSVHNASICLSVCRSFALTRSRHGDLPSPPVNGCPRFDCSLNRVSRVMHEREDLCRSVRSLGDRFPFDIDPFATRETVRYGKYDSIVVTNLDENLFQFLLYMSKHVV